MSDLAERLRAELSTLSGSFEHFVRCNKRLAENNSDGNIYAWTSALSAHRDLIAKTQALLDSEPSRIRAAVEGERERAASCADLEAFHAETARAATEDEVRDRNAARVNMAHQIAAAIRRCE